MKDLMFYKHKLAVENGFLNWDDWSESDSSFNSYLEENIDKAAKMWMEANQIEFAKWTQTMFSLCELDEYSEDKMKYKDNIVTFKELYEIFLEQNLNK